MDAPCVSAGAHRRPGLLHDGPDAETLRGRLAELRPELDPESSTFRAALLLLCAVRIGQNTDRLARHTGLPRDFVTRCARRLVDNGVWRDGRTVSPWCEQGDCTAAFWSDCAVAEGRLCRRQDQSGALHWAAPGLWRKSYSFVETEAAKRPWVSYETSELEAPTPPAAAASVETAAHPGAFELPVPAVEPPSVAVPTPASGLADLFPGAVWLR